MLVSVTRILNEDDIIEAFVRHNAACVERMIFIDNGSTDQTLNILKKLKNEGLPLTVFQGHAAIFDQVAVNTWLYKLASHTHEAAWIVFLDADEFIDGALIQMLNIATPKCLAIEIPLLNYLETPEDDKNELNVPIRMRWRLTAEPDVFKLAIRSNLPANIFIDAGNHSAFIDGIHVSTNPAVGITLAHYPRRSGWQNLQKSTIGWLKVLAANETHNDRSSHYRTPFELLRDDPAGLLFNPAYLSPGLDKNICREAPLKYLGSPLRYTKSNDARLKALELVLRYAEQLAIQHGQLMAQSPEASRLVESWNGKRRYLF